MEVDLLLVAEVRVEVQVELSILIQLHLVEQEVFLQEEVQVEEQIQLLQPMVEEAEQEVELLFILLTLNIQEP